jgi:hypothetical protein
MLMKAMHPSWKRVLSATYASAMLVACGESTLMKQGERSPIRTITSDNVAEINLAQGEEALLHTYVLSFGSNGLSLAGDSDEIMFWSVDMEERADVDASVQEEKYLRIKGNLRKPEGDRLHNIGCLKVSLKDNVNYREITRLRMATTGIYGSKYEEVMAQLLVEKDEYRPVPILEDSIVLSDFASNTVKNFETRLCFKLDLRNLPADDYSGQIVVQYVKKGEGNSDGDSDDGDSDGDGNSKQPDTEDTVVASCSDKPTVLRANQSTEFKFGALVEGAKIAAFSYSLETTDSGEGAVKGQLVVLGHGHISYHAPASVLRAAEILIGAKPEGSQQLPAVCRVSLIADEDIGADDDGSLRGVPGNVYVLPSSTKKLPDFSAMDAVSRIIVPNFDIPVRAFSAGFPGVKDLFEWFGIRFEGTLMIPRSGLYKFRMNSDDGSNFYIGETKVIDNDGVHAPRAVNGEIHLEAGTVPFRLDYFQGPRFHIALELFWILPGEEEAGYQIIQPMYFDRNGL